MKTLRSILIIAFVAAAFAACDSNPVDNDEHGEHTLRDIHRLALVLNGEDVVVLEANTWADGDPDTIRVAGATDLITLEATTEEGDGIHFDELGDAYSLAFQQYDPDVVEVEQHEEEGWSFHLHGVRVDTTQLELQLLHGDHSDLTTPLIPVAVTAVGGDDHE